MLVLVVDMFNPRRGRQISKFEERLVHTMRPGQPALHSEALSQDPNKALAVLQDLSGDDAGSLS